MTDSDNSQAIVDEQHSFKVIQEMIKVSKQRHSRDGILFIVWGWAWFIMSLISIYINSMVYTTTIFNLIRVVNVVIPVSALIFTIYYLYQRNLKVKTYTGTSLLFIWIGMVVCLVLVNLCYMNILNEIHFSIQHLIQMIFIAFTLFVTGLILRSRLLIICALILAVLAFVSSYFEFEQQNIIQALTWIIGFIIPGHVFYAKRNK